VLENLQPSPSISSDIFQLFVIPMVPWPCAGPSLGAPWSCSSAPRLRFPQWPVPHWTFNERLKKRGRSYFIIVLSNNICIYIYCIYIYRYSSPNTIWAVFKPSVILLLCLKHYIVSNRESHNGLW
jgi:hypothetical protein